MWSLNHRERAHRTRLAERHPGLDHVCDRANGKPPRLFIFIDFPKDLNLTMQTVLNFTLARNRGQAHILQVGPAGWGCPDLLGPTPTQAGPVSLGLARAVRAGPEMFSSTPQLRLALNVSSLCSNSGFPDEN